MSGAELANLVNEAALFAVRRHADEIGAADLDAARDRVLLGLRRSSLVLSPDEKRTVAYHEAGHALLAAVLPHADPVHKVTILPTGMALGVTQQLPAEERQIRRRPELDDALAVRLGGRAAEELVFGVASTGGHDDLVAATDLARHMVREWGMSDRLGHIAWGAQGPVFLGEDLIHTRDYSDETAHVIDEEITRMLDEQAARAAHELADTGPNSTPSPPPCSTTRPWTPPTSAGSSPAPAANGHAPSTATLGLDDQMLGDATAGRSTS